LKMRRIVSRAVAVRTTRSDGIWSALQCLAQGSRPQAAAQLIPLFVQIRLSGHGREPGKRPVSFAEKMAKHHRSPEDKAKKREVKDLADRYVGVDLPVEFQGAVEELKSRIEIILSRLTNPIKAIEKLTVEFNGQKKPIIHLCEVVKVSAAELNLILKVTAAAAAVSNAITNLDRDFTPVRAESKIVVKVPRVTKARRERAAEDIRHLPIAQIPNQLGLRARDHLYQEIGVDRTYFDTVAQELELLKKKTMTELKSAIDEGVQEALAAKIDEEEGTDEV
jgi:hypothetical protein